MGKITDLKQGVKNPNRVNVFIDGKFAFSLDIAQVVDFHLKVGLLVSPEEIEELRKASEFGKLYQRALEWALTRPRSERELRDYLRRKLYASSSDALAPARRHGRRFAPFAPVVAKGSSENASELAELVVARLRERGYIDDEKFARFWVENRFVKKGVSTKRLKMELLKKGVDKDVIENVLAETGRNDEEEIRKIIAKKWRRYVLIEDGEANYDKLIQYLARQGFSFELSKQLVQEFLEESDSTLDGA